MRRVAGFTLIELLVVIAILGALSRAAAAGAGAGAGEGAADDLHVEPAAGGDGDAHLRSGLR